MSMFCYQCQETAKGTGCTVQGVCGKKEDTAGLQDLLIYTVKGLSWFSTQARNAGISIPSKINEYVTTSLFQTITNANFDNEVFTASIKEGLELRQNIQSKLEQKGLQIKDGGQDILTWDIRNDAQLDIKASQVGILNTQHEDIRSLRELITYGLKGLAAYMHHAAQLGYESEELYSFTQSTLASLTNDDLGTDELTALTLKTGEYGVQAMALLDKANTTTYGNPEITEVNIGTRDNPAILISGHDLKDMETLLQQTDGTGVDVYTHSEMLPSHYYPAFKKYKHFVGNYGNAWWKQNREFESFNGPIIMTTNCITPPRESYKDRIYTTGAAGYPGVKHIEKREDGQKDFSAVIEHAKTCAAPAQIEEGSIVGGFAHATVMSLADKVVDAVKTGAIRKFLVMAGCDGRMKGRDYYTRFAQALPQDTVILTAGCAKYRYNKLDLGDIGGIPRVLDAGQCNDSYSLAVIALKLKEIFELNDINELPISYNIAWYEQKAVIVLLALLYLGVKNIHLGPTLPAFLSPHVASLLTETFGISSIGEVDEDIRKMTEEPELV